MVDFDRKETFVALIADEYGFDELEADRSRRFIEAVDRMGSLCVIANKMTPRGEDWDGMVRCMGVMAELGVKIELMTREGLAFDDEKLEKLWDLEVLDDCPLYYEWLIKCEAWLDSVYGFNTKGTPDDLDDRLAKVHDETYVKIAAEDYYVPEERHQYWLELDKAIRDVYGSETWY